MKTQHDEFKVLTDREHLLHRPAMYIGSTDFEFQNDFLIQNDKIEFSEFKIVPGLCKIINEIIDNAIDEAIKTNFKFSTEISVNIDKDKVQVQDNGRGIPVKKIQDFYQPYLSWGKAKAGSNFNDDNHTQIGMNGVGSFATNVFSKRFIGETSDKYNYYKVEFKDNASTFKDSIKPSKENGTTVTFYPDLDRFKVKEIDETHQNYIYQRLLCLSIIFPKIRFKFNKRVLKVKTFKDFIKMFSNNDNNFEIYETDNIKLAILPNPTDDFKHFTYINGLKIKDGGVHVDSIMKNITNILREKLKRYKTLKPADIRNKLQLVCFISNFPNPKFNSQTKEKLTNSEGEFNQFANIDYKFVNKIYKNKAFIDPIVEIYNIKKEFENRKALKDLKKTKRIKSDKFYKATKDEKYILICEGDCLEKNTEIFDIENNQNKKIKDIEIGDLVLTCNQNIKMVINKSKSIKECYKIKLKSGKEIIASKNHRFLVYNKTFEWKCLKDITKDDKLVNNRLRNGLLMQKIKILRTNDTKYPLKIFGENFFTHSSLNHKFLVFDDYNNEFLLKEARYIDTESDLMVLVQN